MKNKKILILGASGMLGIEVLREFSKKKNVIIYATIRNTADKKIIKNYLKKDFEKIRWIKFRIEKNYINRLKILVKNKDFIINCIGTIKPYINEQKASSIENATNVNSVFPHRLNSVVNRKCKIFQIATDCVYNGKDGNYRENSDHNAIDIYGKSKSIGEVKSENFYNIRCSIIGKEIKNFKSLLCWFLGQKKNASIFGFKDHLWNGVTTFHFAKIVTIIILKKVKIPNMLHIIPNHPINKYKLLKLFQKRFKRSDIKINKINSNLTINRTLKTNYININKLINFKLGNKKIQSIEKMIDEIY